MGARLDGSPGDRRPGDPRCDDVPGASELCDASELEVLCLWYGLRFSSTGFGSTMASFSEINLEMWSCTDSALVSSLSDDACRDAIVKDVPGPVEGMEVLVAEADVVATDGSAGFATECSLWFDSASFVGVNDVEAPPSNELVLSRDVSREL